jgi:hypothetical protein
MTVVVEASDGKKTAPLEWRRRWLEAMVRYFAL